MQKETETKINKTDAKPTEAGKVESVETKKTATETKATTPVATATTKSSPRPQGGARTGRAPNKPFKKNFHQRRKRPTRPRSEFDQKIIKIRRVTRVVAGGRRFSFSVAMVIGNRKGSVGAGVAKASDTALAIEKAARKAKKNLIKLKLTGNNSIPYEVSAKYCASVIQITPTKEGKGLSAGSAVKNTLELAGITDTTAKIMTRSKNKLNLAMATLRALEDFKAEDEK